MSYQIKLAEDTISKEELTKLSKWITTGEQLTKGPKTVEFEKKFSNYIGSKYAVFVNSGSSANLVMAYGLLAGGYLKNKKVIVPAISWITTLSPFLQLGFEVILCDCDKNDLGLDINHFKELCKKHKPALSILVHVLGHPNKMNEINNICQENDVLLIEDSCESIGSEYKGTKTGNLALCGSFSFYYGHHISTIEGGAVTTNDRNLYNIMLSIRSHGWARDIEDEYKDLWKKDYNVDEFRNFYTFYHPGYNLRSSDLNAFIGIMQLDKLNDIVKRRSENYNLYKKYIGDEYWCQQSDNTKLSSFAYGLFVENRLETFHYLKKNNIECRPLVCGSMGRQPFWIKEFGETRLKFADIVHDYGMYLPNHLNIDEDKIKYVAEKFKEVAIPKIF